MRESFVIYTAYAEKFKRLNDTQFGQLIRMLMAYQCTGVEQETQDPAVAFAFDVAKVELDIANKKYDEVCEKRRIAGSKGGLAKVANASKCKQKVAKGSKSSKSYHNENDNENDNDNDNDNVNDKDNDSDSLYYSFNSNKDPDNNNNPVKEKVKKESSRYFPNDDLLEKTFSDFREMRKKTKHPMTDRAVELMLNKLTKLSSDPIEQVKILEQSILHGWTDIYELKDDQGRKQTKIESIADRWADVH